MQRLCRLVDRVTVKGSNSPILLYTYDAPALECRGGTIADGAEVARASNEEFFEAFAPPCSPEFRRLWDKALAKYLGGQHGEKADWARAAEYLSRCLALQPDDGRQAGLPRPHGQVGERVAQSPCQCQ